MDGNDDQQLEVFNHRKPGDKNEQL